MDESFHLKIARGAPFKEKPSKYLARLEELMVEDLALLATRLEAFKLV